MLKKDPRSLPILSRFFSVETLCAEANGLQGLLEALLRAARLAAVPRQQRGLLDDEEGAVGAQAAVGALEHLVAELGSWQEGKYLEPGGLPPGAIFFEDKTSQAGTFGLGSWICFEGTYFCCFFFWVESGGLL